METVESTIKPEIFLKKLKESARNDIKTIPKLLKWLGKINKVDQYDLYKKNILTSITVWFIEVCIIRAFVFSLAITFCLSAVTVPPTQIVILAAEGFSLSWFLLVELKRDLWRNENGKRS